MSVLDFGNKKPASTASTASKGGDVPVSKKPPEAITPPSKEDVKKILSSEEGSASTDAPSKEDVKKILDGKKPVNFETRIVLNVDKIFEGLTPEQAISVVYNSVHIDKIATQIMQDCMKKYAKSIIHSYSDIVTTAVIEDDAVINGLFKKIIENPLTLSAVADILMNDEKGRAAIIKAVE